VSSYLFSKRLRTRHKLSIISSLNEYLNLDMNSLAALKHISDSTEEDRVQLRQNFNSVSTLGHFLVASWNAISLLMWTELFSWISFPWNASVLKRTSLSSSAFDFFCGVLACTINIYIAIVRIKLLIRKESLVNIVTNFGKVLFPGIIQ